MAGYLGASPVPQSILKKESKTLTANQTTVNTSGYTHGGSISVTLNGVLLEGAGVDYTATNGSDIVLTAGATAGDILHFQAFNEFTLVGQELTTPTINDATLKSNVTLKNDTHEDSDGGRASKIIYQGEQSGGEISTLAEIEAAHDGTADDQKGDLIFKTNDGSDNNAPTERLRIDSDGSIVPATLGTSNVKFGLNAGNNIASGGNYNTVIGEEAGNDITTGDNNTLIGTFSGDAITTSSSNTAVGSYSMTSMTDGANNVAVGTSALDVDTKGSHTTAIGRNALGSQNFTSATDTHNTACGNNAGQSVTTGTNNTIVGSNAAYALTTSNSNTAIGKSALSAETSSNGNTAVGEGALQTQNVGGSGDARNTAVGLLAGSEITSGHSNTCIGYLAGDDLTTGTQNVFVGYDATSASSSDGNQIVMGYVVDSIGGNYFTFGNNSIGRVYNQFSSNASWTRTSDERIKKDIEANTDLGLDFINDLRTVTYKWKAPSEHPEEFKSYNAEQTEAAYTEKMYGFIAQEVKAAMDTHNITGFNGWHVTSESQGGQQGVSYEMFVMPLVKAIQELSAEVETLKTKVAALEAE